MPPQKSRLDLSKLPDQPRIDLSKLPDQPEKPKSTAIEKAGKIAMTGLEAIIAPFEITGEAVVGGPRRSLLKGETTPFRLPTIAKRFFGEKDYTLLGYPLTTKEPPTDIINETASGLQGLVRGITAPITGDPILESMSEEVLREKNTLPDLIFQLGLAFAGGPVTMAPATVTGEAFRLAGKGAKAIIKPGLTKAGERIALKVAKAQSSKAALQQQIAFERIGKKLIRRPSSVKPQVEATGLSKSDTIKTFKKTRIIERKIEKINNDLRVLEKQGPEQVALTAADNKIQLQTVKLAAEHQVLTKEISEQSTKLAMLSREKTPTKILNSLNKQLDAKIARAEKITTKLQEVNTKYRAQRLQRFNNKRESLFKASAEFEQDLKQLGYTSQEVQNRFVKILRGGTDAIILPETLAETRAIAGVTNSGNPVSVDIVNGIKNSPDLKTTEILLSGPKFIFDKLDDVTNGAFKREIEMPLLNSTLRKRELDNIFVNRVKDIRTRYNLTQDDSRPLRRFIEGKSAAPEGKKAVYSQVAKEFRNFYDELLELQNTHLVRRGKAPIPKREDYVHHLREMAVADDLFLSADDAAVALRIRRRTPKLGFDEKRLDVIPEEELAGIFEATDAYSMKVARNVSYGDMADINRAVAATAQKEGKKNMAEFFQRLGDRLTMDAARVSTTGLKEATAGAYRQVLDQYMNTAAANFAKNVIRGNIGAAINNVGSQILSSIYTGGRRAIAGAFEGVINNLWDQSMKAMVNPEYRSFARRMSKTVRLFEIEQNRKLVALEKTMREETKIEKFGDAVFEFFNEAMVIGAFNQGFRAARASGRSVKQSARIADEIAQRANGIYEDAFRPALISSGSKLGQFVLPISTYIFNAMNVMARDTFLAKLSPIDKMKAAVRIAGTGLALNVGTNMITGRDVFSAGDFIPLWRPLQFGLSGALAIANPENWKSPQAFMEMGVLLANPVGFGLQAMKTGKGVKQLLTGKTTDPRVLLAGPLPKKKEKKSESIAGQLIPDVPTPSEIIFGD